MGKAATEGLEAELFDGRRWSEADARRVIAACEASEESLAEFATRHGIDSQRLYWWRRRLGRASFGVVARTSTPRFVPVTVREHATATETAAMVVAVDGVRIEVRQVDSATAYWVSMVVASLGQERS
jgi:transposase-like protein